MSSGRRHRVLLVPSERSEGGYRLYTDDDLLRLQQILIGRELGFALEEIRRILDDPGFDRRQALLRQLVGRLERTTRMLHSVDAALAAMREENGIMDLEQIFDGFAPGLHEPEVKARWGDSDAYREAGRRTRGYTTEDWKRYRDESAATLRHLAEALKAGRRPDDVGVMDMAERHRASIDRWFYPCSKALHAQLAEMYEADERFAAGIDEYAEGLTAFLSAAIHANARR